jgi:maleylacetate reductase
VFGVKEALVVDYVPQSGPAPDGRHVDGEWRSLEFTFRIAGHRPATNIEE